VCPPSGVKTRMARAQLGDVPRGQGTLMAREEGNVSGTIKAKLETSSLTLALTVAAGDENRTRIISLGSLWRCSAITCGLADLRVC
jgi:hypothetical protein